MSASAFFVEILIEGRSVRLFVDAKAAQQPHLSPRRQFVGDGPPSSSTNPLVVVLREAGIGKTIEFQSEVGRLREASQAAFFIALNQVSDAESWQLVLTGHEADFDDWAASDELAYFFLDAVDEARLKSHAEFESQISTGALEMERSLKKFIEATQRRLEVARQDIAMLKSRQQLQFWKFGEQQLEGFLTLAREALSALMSCWPARRSKARRSAMRSGTHDRPSKA